MFIDVDGFQAVSQRMGREARESVLRALAGSLGRLARRADTVARLGGDEFVMLLEGVHGHTDLAAAAGRVLRALRRPLPVAGSDLPVPVACSVAIALFPDDPPDAASLARNADHNPSFCRGDRSL